MSSRRKNLVQIENILVTANQPPSHPGMWLDKYIKQQSRDDVGGRADFVSQISTLPLPEVYTAHYQRWVATLQNYGAKTRTAEVQGRMIVGLGSESLIETAIALHRTYGVPYIPGSALKGLAASYARTHLEKAAHKVIFGDTDEAGYITFFDALYEPQTGHNKQALHPDIITVHHKGYYQGEKNAAPADWDSPTPIPFLTATGKYLLALAAPDLQDDNVEAWINITFTILEHALKDMGIGAKTSSGYGRMTIETPPPPPIDPEVQKVTTYKQELEAMKDSDVAARINYYYLQWKPMKSPEARTILAQAIIAKVRKAGREKASAEKAWYKELLAFVNGSK